VRQLVAAHLEEVRAKIADLEAMELSLRTPLSKQEGHQWL
jgi:hypothetical protein